MKLLPPDKTKDLVWFRSVYPGVSLQQIDRKNGKVKKGPTWKKHQDGEYNIIDKYKILN